MMGRRGYISSSIKSQTCVDSKRWVSASMVCSILDLPGDRRSLHLERQIIELHDVLHRHLITLCRRAVLQNLVQDLLRMWENRVAVRVVVAPQQSVRANEVASANPDGIVLKRDVEVALPIVARFQRDPEGFSAAAADVIPVEPLEHDRCPARFK